MISVVIPAYNRVALIGETLEGLLGQTLPAGEIIVVDDGSTDGTAEVAESYGDIIRVIRQSNSGPAAARNRGFRESKGDFIHFFDSDDIPVLNKQACQNKALLETGADVVISPWVKGSFTGGVFKPENHVLQQKGIPAGDLIRHLLCDWAVVPQCCLFRRTALEKITGFPPELYVGEDQLLFLRLLLTGAKVTFCPDTLTLYRTDNIQDKLSGSAAGENRRRLHWAKFLIMARMECLEHGIEPSQWSGYRERVWAAAKDLEVIQSKPEAIMLRRQLLKILGKENIVSYALRSWLRQKFGGFQQRLIGRRGSSSLCMGPMTADQWRLSNEVLLTINLEHPYSARL
ncbi:glycosyltransferase family 2 protein [Synoicihabitans lomoniglobus]|uniref:Glycosyltransferase family A protein n=1 Tax=Synoicihabitans lomoniglobus TaxID=2909285 RepID=A0AAF0CQT4_9BACT|nr:glycosyltransferase family 2 protein [Opitutaceae bacterium LMO-M01]WED66347.1 glycosyltransferase family A protein [Opitutaceae bacterium LMO-M01]